jgi:hypothetical protein
MLSSLKSSREHHSATYEN